MIEFIDTVKHRLGVEPVCKVLCEYGIQIAPRTYFAAKKRPVCRRALRDAQLKGHISKVFHDRAMGRGVAGARKVWHLLKRQDVQVARCTVERLMRDLGLQGIRRGHWKRPRTTVQDPALTRPDDMVNRDFSASRPDELWIVDFTYVPTTAGMAFTAFASDAYSRRILGWRVMDGHEASLPADALQMALWIRDGEGADPGGALHHSDAGSEYLSAQYRQIVTDAGLNASVGTVADSYDNAMAESLIGLYKTECVHLDGPYADTADLELATLSWVDWFNTCRIHSGIGYRTPVEFEERHHQMKSILQATA